MSSFLLDDGFLFPASHTVGDGSEDRAHYPANEQGNEQGVWGAGTHSPSFGTGEEFQAIGHGYPDDYRGDDRDPHGSHGISSAPHHAGENLGDTHCNVSHRQDSHHSYTGGNNLRSRSKHFNQVGPEDQN